MDLTTIGGLLAGLALIVISILWDKGNVFAFIHIPSIMITVGGTFTAFFSSYPLKDSLSVFKIGAEAFSPLKENTQQTIDKIIELANIARKEGLLALEEAISGINDPFLKKCVMLIVDGTDPGVVQNLLDVEISFMQARHAKGQGMFEWLATLGPAFGMLGTLIGLINMLRSLDDPSSLGAGMSTALITTFYGVILANMIFNPIANKLKMRSQVEVLRMQIMLEGMLAIQAGENPRLIREKLNSFIAKSRRTGDGGEESRDPGDGDAG